MHARAVATLGNASTTTSGSSASSFLTACTISSALEGCRAVMMPRSQASLASAAAAPSREVSTRSSIGCRRATMRA